MWIDRSLSIYSYSGIGSHGSFRRILRKFRKLSKLILLVHNTDLTFYFVSV